MAVPAQQMQKGVLIQDVVLLEEAEDGLIDGSLHPRNMHFFPRICKRSNIPEFQEDQKKALRKG
jgi:hypothetical protein